MSLSTEKNSHIITGIIVLISIAGILYFGYRAITDNMRKDQENPFDLNLDYYKNNDPALNQYAERKSVQVPLERLTGICLDRQGDLYAAGEGAVIRFGPDGREKSRLEISNPVTCLAADLQGRLYLGMGDHIEIYSGGEKTGHWESLGENSLITSIAVSAERIYLADAGSRVIWKFNQDGRLLGRIGEKNPKKQIQGFIIPSPYFDVGIDPDGRLWAADTGHHLLEQYNDSGDLVCSWGEYSMKIDGFCGCCNPTHFSFLPDGSFVTSEKGIPRVKIYSSEGVLKAVVAASEQFEEGTIGLDLAVSSLGYIYVLDPRQKAVRIFEKKSNSGNGN